MHSTIKHLGVAAALIACAAVRAAEPADAAPARQLQRFVEAFALIKHGYVGPLDDKKLVDDAIAGMAAALDPHSEYLGKDELDEYQLDASGKFVGVGLEVELAGQDVRVISAIENSPADRAGVRAGDVIVSVDGPAAPAAAAATTKQLSKRLRGAAGSVVTLALVRPGQAGARTLQLTREQITDASVKARIVAPGIGWVRVAHFQAGTAAELVAKIREVGAAGAPKGLVLDLRNDPGGLVSAAVGVAAAFLPADAVVFSTRGRMEGTSAVVTASRRYYNEADAADALDGLPDWSRTVPLTVLVNGGSVSAAELVAGALQDAGRATVIGTQTFGKGSIQGLLMLSQDSAVKMTLARYYTPKGRSIQAYGITPDRVVAMRPAPGGAAPAMPRESDLPRHLAAEPADGDARPAAAPASPDATSAFGGAADLPLQAAVALLSSGAAVGLP
jgi:carboxyl-terminal processing protease